MWRFVCTVVKGQSIHCQCSETIRVFVPWEQGQQSLPRARI